MHAVQISVTFNDLEAAKGELPGLAAQVSGIPGSSAAHWVAFSGDRGTALVVFDSEEGARTLEGIARGATTESVTTQSIEVGEVLAQA